MKEILPLSIKDLRSNIFIQDINLKLIADIAKLDHAEFIVRSCNAHYELVEALKRLMMHDSTHLPTAAEEQDRAFAKHVIAKAEEKK